MSIVKADAYGHGAIPVAKVLDPIADAYGVAILEEGIELRQAGITKPILILGFTPAPLYPSMIEYDIATAVFQYDMAKNGAEREDKAAAAALVERAKGAVAEVESYIKETCLLAQAPGEVSEIFPKVGELGGTGAPIMNIAILEDMWVTFNVREDLLQGLGMNTEFEAFIPALDKNIRLKVYYMKDLGTYAAWKATKTTGQFDLKTFEVKASPLEKVEGLRPGMSVILKK